jgi:hypothetical protein
MIAPKAGARFIGDYAVITLFGNPGKAVERV